MQQAAMWQWIMQQQGGFAGAPPFLPGGPALGPGAHPPGAPAPWFGPGAPSPGTPWTFGAPPADPAGPGGWQRGPGGPEGQRAPAPVLLQRDTPAEQSRRSSYADAAAGLPPTQQAHPQAPGAEGPLEGAGVGAAAGGSEKGRTIVARRRAVGVRGMPGTSDAPPPAQRWEKVPAPAPPPLPPPPPPPGAAQPTSSGVYAEGAPAGDLAHWDVQGAREPARHNGGGSVPLPPGAGGGGRRAVAVGARRPRDASPAGSGLSGGASLGGSSRQPSGELAAGLEAGAEGRGLANGVLYGNGGMAVPGYAQAREGAALWGAHAPARRLAVPLGAAQAAPRPFGAQPWQGAAVRSGGLAACTS